jgi:hypothetical protein
MNNWDSRHEITVVHVANDLPKFVSGVVLSDVMEGAGSWESNTVTFTGFEPELELEVVKDGIAEDHLDEVLNCLRDHMANTTKEDWLSHQSDLLVDEKEWLWVDVSYGTYHGPNCTVHVWYAGV